MGRLVKSERSLWIRYDSTDVNSLMLMSSAGYVNIWRNKVKDLLLIIFCNFFVSLKLLENENNKKFFLIKFSA